ncbi:MAG: hypothetical protein WC307_03970, partial [Candidatus Nanoarchaeia archaeon]
MSVLGMLLKMAVMVVIVVVLALTGVVLIPQEGLSAVDDVSSLLPSIDLSKEQCSLHCYGRQEQGEINLITGGELL